jgi:hypothetical protein
LMSVLNQHPPRAAGSDPRRSARGNEPIWAPGKSKSCGPPNLPLRPQPSSCRAAFPSKSVASPKGRSGWGHARLRS